jgi:DnaJ-class molecular chaperone
MPLAEAITLFRRLGVDVETMCASDFSLAYFALAKRYHPDRNPDGAELMANINAARTAIVNSRRGQTSRRCREG